ncbi:RagB/SusD family nutrient uptake outer membrane protein [Flavobacterium oreochromis]|uniref:RagB/SusD family nutrient uptake outer membrane protein n=1 Tax=Flavobacterium oreochromis TaxID=2906078 RepID=UPI00385C00EE
MKRFKKYISLAILTLAFSCQDASEIVQDGELNSDLTIASVADMQKFLNGTYGRIMSVNSLSTGIGNGSSEIGVSSLLTDEVGIGKVGNANDELYRFKIFTSNSRIQNIWANYNGVINYANRLLEGAKFVTPQNAAEVIEYRNIIAQAKALRAFSHFQLMVYFSSDLKNNNALGTILLNRTPKIDEKFLRSTNGELFAFIEEDLDYAFNNIQPITTGTKPWSYVSKSMINAFRARMYAYRGNYTLAEQYADWVISNSGLTLVDGTVIPTGVVGSTDWNTVFYGASTPNDYRKMWADLNRGEVIWALARQNTPSIQGISGFYNTNASNIGGAVLFDMGRKTFNLLNNNWDIRRYTNIDPTSVIAKNYDSVSDYKNNDVLVIDKYPGIPGAGLVNDIKVFRLSEIYLIKAECLANKGNLNGADNSVAAILKQIRDKRSYAGARPLPVYANETESWADILLERRLELCFEGHRYIDIKRLGRKANLTIDRDPLDCDTYSLNECSMSVTDSRFTLPIPINELNANPNIQQNSGY